MVGLKSGWKYQTTNQLSDNWDFDIEESITSLLFKPLPNFLISFIIPDKNKLITEEEKLIPIKAKDLTNISLDEILELDVELLDIFSQEKQSLIKNIAWNTNKVKKDAITLRLN